MFVPSSMGVQFSWLASACHTPLDYSLWKHFGCMNLSWLQRRSASRSQREKDNREAESMLTVAGPKGDTEWERALDYVNFGFTRPNGSDLSRMKGLLFSAKSKNVPVKSKS